MAKGEIAYTDHTLILADFLTMIMKHFYSQVSLTVTYFFLTFFQNACFCSCKPNTDIHCTVNLTVVNTLYVDPLICLGENSHLRIGGENKCANTISMQ